MYGNKLSGTNAFAAQKGGGPTWKHECGRKADSERRGEAAERIRKQGNLSFEAAANLPS